MKILVYGINFAPEPTGIGKYTGEMAAWLAEAGHDVRVVAAPPYYPAWRVSDGYSAGAYRTEECDGVRVWRCPLWVPTRPGGARRVLHLLSFAISSLPVVLGQVAWRPDVVWVAAPAFTCAPGAWLAARLCGAKAWLHVQDFELDVAFDMGLLRGNLLRRVVTGLERWLLRRFDVVSSISQSMLQRLSEKGVARGRIVSLPNWVDIHAIVPLTRPSKYRQILGIAPDAVVALFSGTLGAKQALHLLPLAARLLETTAPDVVIVICGDGVMKPQLEVDTQGVRNVRMLPLQPKEQLGELLGMADMHLLPQDSEVADLVMPSKLTAMLSSGRPVVTNARSGSEAARVIAQCGVVADSSDATALAEAIGSLAREPAKRVQLGRAAREYAEKHIGTDGILSQFSLTLIALSSESGSLADERVSDAARK